MKEKITSTRVCVNGLLRDDGGACATAHSALAAGFAGSGGDGVSGPRQIAAPRRGWRRRAWATATATASRRRVALTAGTIAVRRPRMQESGRALREPGAAVVQAAHGGARGDAAAAVSARAVERGLRAGAARAAWAKGHRCRRPRCSGSRALWQAEYETTGSSTDLSELELVYWWADGLYVKAGHLRSQGGAAGDRRGDRERARRYCWRARRASARARNRGSRCCAI